MASHGFSDLHLFERELVSPINLPLVFFNCKMGGMKDASDME